MIRVNADAFARALDAEFAAAEGKAREFRNEIARDALTGIVTLTPFKTGHARNSWISTAGQPSEEHRKVLGGSAGAPPSAQQVGELESALSGAAFGTPIYTQSNAPHIVPLEHGHSKQAPAGMLRVTYESLRHREKRA